jgi:hypothetical protein
MRRLLTMATVVAVSLVAHVEAITVVPMTFEQLVQEATAVVYARVTDVRGQWRNDRRSIDSVITLEALHYMKGELGQTVLMRLPGGEAGGVINVLPGAPVLREGDLVVVFLAGRGPAIPTALGLGQGIFRVGRDPRSATALVSPPPLKASAAGLIIRGAADRRTLTLEAFESHVRATGGAR